MQPLKVLKKVALPAAVIGASFLIPGVAPIARGVASGIFKGGKLVGRGAGKLVGGFFRKKSDLPLDALKAAGQLGTGSGVTERRGIPPGAVGGGFASGAGDFLKQVFQSQATPTESSTAPIYGDAAGGGGSAPIPQSMSDEMIGPPEPKPALSPLLLGGLVLGGIMLAGASRRGGR